MKKDKKILNKIKQIETAELKSYTHKVNNMNHNLEKIIENINVPALKPVKLRKKLFFLYFFLIF